ncbi:hypothetical protein VMT65_07745 [Nocardia sp. CDC153]|uniref:hypothetical protein n=1 Tax=Nocardia sp. CDC153 TaxID=3112167 RepID=UPI002DBB801E|nr:hypothetical protein [Nocardia sp. CDC153]MEC3952918.1 hypothetical protein [Nocardia sp. CDC153]
MGTKAIDPQSIRNVTIIGDPDETSRLVHRVYRHVGGPADTVRWATDRIEHTIRIATLPIHAPLAQLERSIRVADSLIAVAHAAAPGPRLETILRVADDHQVARLCLVTALDRPAADFPRCVRTIADIRGATPVTVHVPLGTGPEFAGGLDLIATWDVAPLAAEIHGIGWETAEAWYRGLAKAVLPQPPGVSLRSIPVEQLHHRIRSLTRIGEIVPILCSTAPTADDIPSILDAITRYLPSPMDVCQPEHALD